jgi:hypothetical protein
MTDGQYKIIIAHIKLHGVEMADRGRYELIYTTTISRSMLFMELGIM